MYGLSFLYENRGYLARPWCLNAGGPPKKLYSIEHIKKNSLNRRISRPYILYSEILHISSDLALCTPN